MNPAHARVLVVDDIHDNREHYSEHNFNNKPLPCSLRGLCIWRLSQDGIRSEHMQRHR